MAVKMGQQMGPQQMKSSENPLDKKLEYETKESILSSTQRGFQLGQEGPMAASPDFTTQAK